MKRTESAPASDVRQVIRRKLEDRFDVNYSVSEIRIESLEDFDAYLYAPYRSGEKLYYRGERILSDDRRLVPTLLRKKGELRSFGDEPILRLTSESLLRYYRSKKSFFSVYETLYGRADTAHLYKMLAFAQHYLDVSPLIDLSKSLYVALSFALKGRTEFSDDVVLYSVYDIGDDDTSSDLDEVNGWLREYHVNVVDFGAEEAIQKLLQPKKERLHRRETVLHDLRQIEELVNAMNPTAKLIDIPTNDLMKYQQGVFLLLNGFSLIDSKYFTKDVRKSFVITKYVVSAAICPTLQKFLLQKAPQYRYENLMDISAAVKDER